MANAHFYPVVLAGGRGTRFWPLSRKRRAKQLLALDGSKTMIQQTIARLRPLAPKKNFWIITNADLRKPILHQLKGVPKDQVIAEPEGRNTAPAIGLAAFILAHYDPDAVLGLFPSDHVIGDEKRFRNAIEKGVAIAAGGENIVVLGIQPTRPETGYGYIQTAPSGKNRTNESAVPVRRFTEKPNAERAQEMLREGNYFWNSGMFLWKAITLVNALREYLPKTATILEQIAAEYGTRRFEKALKKLYGKAENISVDYAVLEPRSARAEAASGIFCIPAEFGWNDLGSWTALHEHKLRKATKADEANIIDADDHVHVNAKSNYVYAPGKFVAMVGVSNIVVVHTEDALLVTTLDASQDVGKVVKFLDEKKLKKLV